jgi:AcrR family transcriptional regulator
MKHDIVIYNDVMYRRQVPRAKNPDVGERLLEAAARLLAEHGREAVTARRLAAEIGTSTMAVYTHFGSMDELVLRLWREGFARFGAALDEPSRTDDPVADWAAQGWAYRRFALENRHLYRIMFGDGFTAFRAEDPADQAAAAATFAALLQRLQRAADAGRLVIDDLPLAGQVVWSMVHGHMTIELTGYFGATGRDPADAYRECLRRLALAFGAGADELARSLAVADTLAVGDRGPGTISRR